ncbi:MAG: cell division protein FtsZ [Hydrotalea sp.]|nr:cell division protein FtsZ [Hydrotalea sp.]
MSFNPNIVVFGVGGAGCNAVNNMVEKKLQGVQFVAANTDMQSLIHSNADVKIQLGTTLTQGLGAGGNPEIGREAARENIVEIKETLKNCNMLFITAGMGGGTGTGAAPLVAKIAKELGVLTIGVITKPFSFEGRKKMDIALDGIRAMKDQVGTLIIVPNQNLMSLANEKTTNREAFMLADQVLYNGVAGISDVIVRPGHINLDLADLRGVMSEMGRAVLGTGEATGKDRATVAAQRAIQNPLLENTDIAGAKQLLINISGGEDLTLFETEKSIAIIAAAAGEHCNIHIGSSTDPALNGKIRVSLVATGIKGEGAGVASHLLKSLQGATGFQGSDRAGEHLAAIKNTALNPLNPLRPQYDEEGEEAMDESEEPYRQPNGLMGGMVHKTSDEMSDEASNVDIDGMDDIANVADAAPATATRDNNSGRPVFNNPFAKGSPIPGDSDDAADNVEDRLEYKPTLRDATGDEATDSIADEMAEFDNFSQAISKKEIHKEETEDNAAWHDAADSARYRSNVADLQDEQDDAIDNRRTAHGNDGKESGGKKTGLFKKIFSAFFGDKDGQDDDDGDGPYPEVVDLRGDMARSATAEDDKPRGAMARGATGDNEAQHGKSRLKHRLTRKKQRVEEEITYDLFSMPGIELKKK